MQTVPGNKTHSADIKDLRKFVQYQVQVLAYTRMGDGKLSEPKSNVKTHQDGKFVALLRHVYFIC